MASNRTLLLSTLKKITDLYRHEKLPLTGVMGSSLRFPTFRTDQHIASFVANGNNEEGLSIIQRLNRQRDFLLQTGPLDEEDSPRTVLAGWHLIQEKYSRAPFTPLIAALAVEDGALHTQAIAVPPRASWWLEDEDPRGPLELAIACSSHLDNIADAVRRHSPSLFGAAGRDAALSLASAEQMAAVAHVLSEQMRFRQDPFEWVYDGFKPLLLTDIVVTRKGMSVSLSTMVICVMRRLGVTALPCFSTYAGVAQAKSDELAQMHMGRPIASTPAATGIILQGGTTEDPCILDPCAKRGQWFKPLPQASKHHEHYELSQGWSASDVFRIWAEHASTMIVACQRRGQSDDVCNWTYQHAALDPQHALFPGVT